MKLSVIVSTYNRPNDLLRCLKSLRRQEFIDQIVVVDQSEYDDSKKICNGFRLDYFKIEGRNISKSRNFGISKSIGEIIAFIDDDAEAVGEWSKEIIVNFKNSPSLVMLCGKVIRIKDGEKILQYENGIVSEYGYIEDIHPQDEKLYIKGFNRWYLRPMGTNMAFRKDIVIKIGGFDEFYEYNHDETDLALRLIKEGLSALYSNKMIVYHYQSVGLNRQNEFLVNYFAEAKNNTYFGLKHSKDNLIIKYIKVIKRVFGPWGPLGGNFKSYKLKRYGFRTMLILTGSIISGFFRGVDGYLKTKKSLSN